MLGRSMYARADPSSLRRAVDYFKQAAEKDTSYAAPLVGLRGVYDLLENVEPGKYKITGPGPSQLVRRAMELDPTNGEVRLLWGSTQARACDDVSTEREYGEAVRLSPGSSEIRRTWAIVLSYYGRHDEALRAIREAADIDPTSPWVLSVLTWTYSVVGQHDSALAVSERALALDSTQWVSHAVRGAALALAGRPQEGVPFLERARSLGGDGHGQTTGFLGWAYARAGRRQDAQRIAQLLAARVARGEATRWHVAYVYAGLGENEKAFEWLAKPPQPTDWKAADNGFNMPMLEPLRSDPRFAELAKRRWCQPAA
jgi:tetratricopeptide (TPR) repeat protein